MSTTAIVSYDINENHPNLPSNWVEPFSFYRRACFGTLNCLPPSNNPAQMENVEWHPESTGGLRNSFSLINSLGMWKDVFHITSIGSISASVRNNPADCVITGLMSMRDHQNGGMSSAAILGDAGELSRKIGFALYFSGIYRNRGYSPGRDYFNIHTMDLGEGGILNLPSTTDAIALYLLVYGSKEEFQGCWAQSPFGVGPNSRGYVRNSSFESDRQAIRQSRPAWNSLADWMKSWLLSNPEHLQGKLGRLTIRQFLERLNSRINLDDTSDRSRKDAILLTVFEELREFYS